jgi:Notch-like protein
MQNMSTLYSLADIDDCSPDPCQYGATCSDDVDSYTCTCAAGYTGTNCDIGKKYA